MRHRHLRDPQAGRRFQHREADPERTQRRGPHARGANKRRPFGHGDLRFLVLRLIAEAPRHGYEIIKAIEEDVGGSYSPSPGVVYPTLTLLEEMGHARLTESEGGKKRYAITPEGTAYLAENRTAAEAVDERLRRAREMFGGGPPAPVVRAMENLRLAVRLRLGRGAVSEEEARTIAAALDAAAIAVERA